MYYDTGTCNNGVQNHDNSHSYSVQCICSLVLFRLVLLLPPPLYFSFLVDHLIGERVIHVWNARVLVIEGDKL